MESNSIYSEERGKSFTAQNPAFRERIMQSFEAQQMMKLLGAQVDRVDPGHVTLSLAYRDELTQQHGLLHGGLVGLLLDTACSGAAFTLFPAGTAILAVEYKVNFLAPARGVRLIAAGHVIKPGRSLTVAGGEAHMVDESGEHKLVATSQATLMRLTPSGEIPEG